MLVEFVVNCTTELLEVLRSQEDAVSGQDDTLRSLINGSTVAAALEEQGLEVNITDATLGATAVEADPATATPTTVCPEDCETTNWHLNKVQWILIGCFAGVVAALVCLVAVLVYRCVAPVRQAKLGYRPTLLAPEPDLRDQGGARRGAEWGGREWPESPKAVLR